MFYGNAQNIVAIRKEFIKNLDGFLQNDFHLKSLTRLNTFLIRVCNGHFDHWFSNTKAFFVWHMEFAQRETLSSRFI